MQKEREEKVESVNRSRKREGLIWTVPASSRRPTAQETTDEEESLVDSEAMGDQLAMAEIPDPSAAVEMPVVPEATRQRSTRRPRQVVQSMAEVAMEMGPKRSSRRHRGAEI